jgi:hypothetical protein
MARSAAPGHRYAELAWVTTPTVPLRRAGSEHRPAAVYRWCVRSMPAERSERKPLWTCPLCARSFANRNQTHTCRPLGDLDRHFAGTSLTVRATFDRMLAALAECGPCDVLAEQTRIALHVRMSFAAFVPRKRWLDGHLVLDERIDSDRFRKIETYSPRNVVHVFRLSTPDDVDAEFVDWLRRAYRVGCQAHLTR